MKNLKSVKSTLQKYYNLSDNPTYIFGSRSDKSHRSNSDLDIFMEDNSFSSEVLIFLEEEFEKSNILFKVDIVLKSRIDDNFYNKIKSTLKKIH